MHTHEINTSDIDMANDIQLTKTSDRVVAWANEFLPKLPKQAEDFHIIFTGETFNRMSDMLTLNFDNDPQNCQQQEKDTPPMWIATGESQDTIQPNDIDVEFFGRNSDNPEEGLYQAAIHRLSILGIGINDGIREREHINYKALSRTVISFPNHPKCPNFMPTSRWIIQCNKNNDGSLFIKIRRESMYYLWAYWSKVMEGGRENAMAQPKIEQKAKQWNLPSPQ